MSILNLHDWLNTPLGAYTLAREQAFFDQEVANIFGYNAVQLGLFDADLLRASRMPFRFCAGRDPRCQVQVDTDYLPFASQSIDLALMPHILEFSTTPHQILREVERVLMPEGQVIISGFNPLSLWGLPKLSLETRNEFPWNGHFITLLRLKDWLALLGLEVTGGRLGCYAPPVRSERWLRRYRFLEKAGDRWWALGGGVYFLVARKRVPGMRLIKPGWSKQKQRKRALAPAKPVAHSHAARTRRFPPGDGRGG